MAAPQVLSRKANGVLPVAATQTTSDAPKAAKTKAPADGEKVVIRRLPPGMTEDECIKLLGEDWKAGNGKVDWFSYQPGKISQDPSKPSRPARAYLHLKKREEALPLNEYVKTIAWEDAKETYNSPSLIAPPAVELSIYKKVPSGKRRNDGRQGTIDQDQEFMDFLEALANPTAATKEGDAEQGAEEDGKASVKATSTPLIDYLREKKANKGKDGSKSGKHGRQESQGGKGKGSSAAGDDSKKRSKESKSTDKPKETVKILTKKQAAEAAAEAAKVVANQLGGGSTQEAPKSRRAGIAAAARILERDLGLSPGTAHRRARLEAAKQDAAKKADTDTKASTSNDTTAAASSSGATSGAPPSAPTAPKSQAQESSKSSRGSKSKKQAASADSAKTKGEKATDGPSANKTPVILLKKKDESTEKGGQKTAGSSTSATNASTAPPTGPKAATAKGAQGSGPQRKGGQSQAPTPGATRAFVKHANPSQGVTEPLLKEAMQIFGTVTFVEIDRRKGFAYVDFAEAEGLVKAISASPVSVADATVQVLERKETGSKKGAAPQPTTSNGAATTSGATASAAPAEKGAPSAASDHKRGGRRRGGRGKDAAKDGAGSTGKSGDQATSGTPAAGPVASSSAG